MKGVLLADDKEENLYYLEALLRGHGFRVRLARHGAEALVLARQEPPDLIVSDLLMPIMDGYTLLRHWKADAQLKHIPFVVYTATYTEAKDERLALDLGADAFILKPAEPQEFLDRLREVWERVSTAPVEAKQPVGNESELLKVYSETLIRKLEEKAIELQEANQALRERESEQRRLAEQLRTERERLITAQAVAKIGSWEIDLASHALTWSMEMHRIFETDAAAFVPTLQSFAACVHEEDRAQFEALLMRSIDERTAGSFVHRLRGDTDAAPRVVEQRWEIIEGSGAAEGGGPRAAGTCQDVSERVVLERQLRQAQRLESVGQLTGGVAHDFNNLLTVILGNAEMLSEELVARSGAQDLGAMAQVVVEAAQRAAELTQRLLAFARKQALEPRAVDINRLVEAMDAILRRTLGEHIRIEFEREQQLWAALVDPAQLDNTLLNLCLNARDAMPRGGRLAIATGNALLGVDDPRRPEDVKPGAYVMLSVSDTGVGIEPQHLGRVFEPFFTTKEKGKGTGLGLAMTYGFVKQSGGHVNIQSQPGQGTKVTLYLPRAEGAQAADAGAARQMRSAGGAETILLVEDDELVRSYAHAQLLSLGYTVLQARDGAQALQMLGEGARVDLLFTDVVMPGMSGWELAQKAVQARPGLRVLYTSGYAEGTIVHDGRLDEGVQLLAKPYRRDELARRVRRALDAPAPQARDAG